EQDLSNRELHPRLSASTSDFCRRVMILPGRRLIASTKAARATVIRSERNQHLDVGIAVVPHLDAIRQRLILVRQVISLHQNDLSIQPLKTRQTSNECPLSGSKRS